MQNGLTPLSQEVLLALAQQTAVDVQNDPKLKMAWLHETLMAINPRHPVVAPYLDKVLNTVVEHVQALVVSQPQDVAFVRQSMILMHIANSLRQQKQQ